MGLLLALAACGGAERATAPVVTRQPCRTGTAACFARFEVTPGRFVRSYQSTPVAAGDSTVTQAVIVVHGVDRNANEYFAAMTDAAALAGTLATTLVIAPQFITTDDAPAADEPVWTSSGWRAGDLSSSSAALPRVSSYAVIDTVLVRLADRSRFPRLTRVVVAGHSGGAQLVHRYAATSRTAGLLTGISARFVAANPSTWLYLGPERATGDVFRVPATASTCPDYDDWHYGLQNRNTYATAMPAAQLQQQLVNRDVVVMLGTADTLTADLDVSCGADLQGPRRWHRGQTLMAYMNARYAGHRHQLVTVPNVGHSYRGMFTASEGVRAIFR
jgi:pimeloyl-ACP methyl ester carboxylesterase